MPLHHLALATRDLAATHRFYTEVMGFRLAKVVASPTPKGGWAKHAFYDTGSGDRSMIAFWDLHDDTIGTDFPTDLNRSLGLPEWVNHVAFDAGTIDEYEAHLRRWREHGITVAEVDHGWCRSIYTTDPNGVLVEFCCTTRALDDGDARQAERLLGEAQPELEPAPPVQIHAPLLPAGS